MKRWEIWEIKKLIPEFQSKYPDYKNFIEWNNTLLYKWEYKLLLHIEAINANGILSNYPLLEAGDNYQDYDGDIELIKNKIEEINNDRRIKTKAKIIYCPRNYSLWIELREEKVRQEISQFKAKEYNEVPISNYEEINNFKVEELNFK